MYQKGKTQIFIVLMIICTFILQNCATIFHGTSTKIPVTSNPLGAKIIVNGEEMGQTPFNLHLKRKKNYIIRIEKQEYNPLEIRITRKVSPFLSILGNSFVGLLAAVPAAGAILPGLILGGEEAAEELGKAAVLSFFVGWGGAILIDFLTGANHGLSPKELNVTLSKVDGKPRIHFVMIDEKQVQNIKWIRVKCLDSDHEEVLNLNFQ